MVHINIENFIMIAIIKKIGVRTEISKTSSIILKYLCTYKYVVNKDFCTLNFRCFTLYPFLV